MTENQPPQLIDISETAEAASCCGGVCGGAETAVEPTVSTADA